MAQTFSKPRLMRWNSNAVTDHNRAELSVQNERIENMQRMVNGTMRKYVTADKRTFSTSWTDVPSKLTFTVDGFWGADEIETFYYANQGAFTLELTYSNNTTSSVNVMFTDFSKSLKKRGKYDFYDVSISMEEV